jgi:hypothetical protein
MFRFRGYFFSDKETENSQKFSGIFSRKIIPENSTSLHITLHPFKVSDKPVVATCTTRFTIQKFYVLPTVHFYVLRA